MTEQPPEQSSPQATPPTVEPPRPIPRPGPPPGVTAAVATRIDTAVGPGRRRRRGVRPHARTAPRTRSRWASGSPATPPTASAFYERKYATLGVEIDLLEHRLGDAGLAPMRRWRSSASCATRSTAPTASETSPPFVPDSTASWRPSTSSAAPARPSETPPASRARAQREALVVEAEKLAESTQWKATGDRFRVIVEEWRTAPHAERSYEQELWKRLSHARSAFEKRRRAWFADARRRAHRGRRRQGEDRQGGRGALHQQGLGAHLGRLPHPDAALEERRAGHARGRARALDSGSRRHRTPSSPLVQPSSTNVTPSRSRTWPRSRSWPTRPRSCCPISDLNAARTSLRTIQDRWAADRSRTARRQAGHRATAAERRAGGARCRGDASGSGPTLRPAPGQLPPSSSSPPRSPSCEKQRDAAAAPGSTSDVEKAEAAIAARQEWLAQAESTLHEFSD